jgi:HindIII-like restriction endonuclease
MTARTRRDYWVDELARISVSFGADCTKMFAELKSEIERDGQDALLDHLRLCGAMPEQYGHDSSEEKLYSKYTDAVVSESLQAIGLRSIVIEARADVADVQAIGRNYSLVADAKAFRLSRTAKNQKDFKVQAMDGWRSGHDYAVVACPIYQLPGRSSQIYQQAVARDVCILSYSHLATLVALAGRRGAVAAEDGLHDMLRAVSLLHPSKSAVDYWGAINGALSGTLKRDSGLWTIEKTASLTALDMAKDEALQYLRTECARLLRLSHQEALDELIRVKGLNARIETVEQLNLGQLLEA